MTDHDPKRISGRAAADLVQDGTDVGLGTGSTVFFVLERLAERIRDEGLRIRGVPTSVDTEQKARAMGIPLATLDDVERLDLTIDGADEIDPAFAMTKGGGGALLREKVVAHVSDREAIVVGANKLVPRLATTFRLPVEIVPFSRAVVEREVVRLGAQPELRGGEQEPYVTDNGNWILDCTYPDGIEDPARMERSLDAVPGVVETGLFVGLAHVVCVGYEDGRCEVVEREDEAGVRRVWEL